MPAIASRRGLAVVWLAWALASASVPMGSGAMSEPRIAEAVVLMSEFAVRTGVDSERTARRYLWTDAFAVCNFLGLARATGEGRYLGLASRLVDQVHHTLGRHRADDSRRGWISGLGEGQGEAHPTRGGLRIGKRLPERGPGEPFDEALEWERDGQYFHYLTKWMHALDQLARATGGATFSRWASELAEAAYAAFTYAPFGPARPRRMYWKMSIDLTRPLVGAMGQHDPLDGYVTYAQLRATAASLPQAAGGPSLAAETVQLAAMVEGGDWATADPLGLGGLLTDAYRLQQLQDAGARVDDGLVEALLGAALAGLERYARSPALRLAADERLAFRELGLAIGLQAAAQMREAAARDPRPAGASAAVRARLQALAHHVPLGEAITAFWRDPVHRRAGTWAEHRDINEVMLATSLVPEGFLVLAPGD